MGIVFVAGSRSISRLAPSVVERIEGIVARREQILVGDANGVDKATQDYLLQRGYDRVEVFCSSTTCRNNRGAWPVRTIPVGSKSRNFAFYAAKDMAMAEECSEGLMIWDGKSTGTIVNCARLVKNGKPVAVFLVPEGKWVEFRSESGLAEFFKGLPEELISKIEEKSHPMSKRSEASGQLKLF